MEQQRSMEEFTIIATDCTRNVLNSYAIARIVSSATDADLRSLVHESISLFYLLSNQTIKRNACIWID
jgi:hypothetical protein